MSAEPPLTSAASRARSAYRKVGGAAGVTGLPALEARLDRLEVGVDEEVGLATALAEVLGRVETSLVPLLEARARRTVTQDTPHAPPSHVTGR